MYPISPGVYNKWRKGLNIFEIFALIFYRLSSNGINKMLRSKTKGSKNVIDNFYVFIEENLDSAIRKAEIIDNIAVYRNIAKHEYKAIKKLKIGDNIDCPTYKGTHVRKYISGKNLPSAYAIILIPKGTRCACINYWVRLFHENELLLYKGLNYKLENKIIINGRETFIFKVL